MARSVSSTYNILYPYEDVMVIERVYEYVKGVNAKRAPIKLPKKVREGWKFLGTSSSSRETCAGGLWIVHEIYIHGMQNKAATPKKKAKKI